DARAVPVLADLVLTDRDTGVRQMAAFALGEIESPGGAYALVSVLKNPDTLGRAQAVEALVKIVEAVLSSAPPTKPGTGEQPEDKRPDALKAEILSALRFEDGRRPQADRETILLGLTAVLRIRPEGAGPLIVKFLDYPDPAIVATALNTM